MFMLIVIILVIGFLFVTSYNNMQRLATDVKNVMLIFFLALPNIQIQ